MRTVFTTVCAALVSLSSTTFAGHRDALQAYETATTLFKSRSEAGSVEKMIPLLTGALDETQDEGLRYKILVLHSRALYWQGTQTEDTEKKKEIHLAGNAIAKDARDENPDFADALYFEAAHLGRWAEANGIVQSLVKKGEVMDTLEEIFDLDTVKLNNGEPVYEDGEPVLVAGEEFEGFGADRILGRLYFKLPGWAGGSLEKALRHLGNAYENAPEYALNVIYYAEALYGSNKADREKAKQVLDKMLQQDPNTYNLLRLPETQQEFKDARKIRNEMT